MKDVSTLAKIVSVTNQLILQSRQRQRRLLLELLEEEEATNEGTRLDCPTIPRIRKSVRQIFRELGPNYFRRSFRMRWSTFKQLYFTLKPSLVQVIQPAPLKKRKRSPNGPIALPVRLAVCLRFFAGGDAYDIAVMFGISHSSVFTSVDYVIDAINLCDNDSMKIEFPSDHNKQLEIANALKKRSDADFDCCAGLIDGIIIWTHKPSEEDCIETGVSSKKYLCGRKHKFGLNCQAVCDHKKRFMDISILFGASASDHLAFELSDLRQKLSTPGFLHEMLCLFGDNAYVNTRYMATPYANIGEDMDKDAYNFYHSQLRILIECAFGLLVQRWGFLRKKAPQQFTVRKIQAAVYSLCKLHNYLINVNDEVPIENSQEDQLNLTMSGAVPLASRVRHSHRVAGLPLQLLDAGDHFDDDPTRQFRNAHRRSGNVVLPRESMFNQICESNLRRPVHNINRRNGQRRR